MRKIRIIIEHIIIHILLRRHNVILGKDAVINGIPQFVGKNITIGDFVRINSGRRYNPIGGDTQCTFWAIGNGTIQVGNNVGISNSTLAARSRIVIGDDVLIGGSCKVYDSDFHSIQYQNRIQIPDPDVTCKPVEIQKGAFIGAHSIILKGVTVGAFSVIGAGSVVTKSVPPYEIWAGNPARRIGYVKTELH